MKDETAGLIVGAVAGALIMVAAREHARSQAERIVVPAGVHGRPQYAAPGRVDRDALADMTDAVLSVARATPRIIRAYRSLSRVFRN